MPTRDMAASLLDRLEALPPRMAALLERSLVERIPIPQLIEHLGVEPCALALSLWRAARAFSGAPQGEDGPKGRAAAQALLRAVETGGPLPDGLDPVGLLRTHADQVLALAHARHDAHARWEGFVRAALAVALVFLALWMSR